MNYTSAQQHVCSYCPVCNSTNIRWNPLPNYYLNAWRQYGFKHIGSGEMTPLFTYLCPVCNASDRERLYALFLSGMKREGVLPTQMIHFAPEAPLSKRIRQAQYFTSYQTADYSMRGVDFHADLQSLTFESEHFDFFICSHVLEHVPDDRKAFRELFRITRPGGFGILMAPISLAIDTTIEDPDITDESERWRLFGQNDHLRLYSHDDYVKRIQESGFLVHQITGDDFGEDIFWKLGLKPSSVLYVVEKPFAPYLEKSLMPKKVAAVIRSSMPFTTNSPTPSQDDMRAPKVSVILTSFNHGKFIEEAIESVLSQTYRDFELIIWDDASTDDSWSIIQNCIKHGKDGRIRAFKNEIQSYHYFDKSFAEVQGKYIAIHHSDDVWELEKLEKQVNFLDQHPDVGAVFSWVNIIDEHGKFNNDVFLHKLFRQDNKTRYEWLRHFFFNGNALCHPSILIRKQCYTDCGFPNPALYQLPDFDMWVRLCFGYEIHVLPEYLVKFRWKSDRSNTSARSRESLTRIYFEYYMILNRYSRIVNIEEFLKIFPSSEKYCTHPDANVEFALAMTAIEHSSGAQHRLFGLQLLHNLISSPDSAMKIYKVYRFDIFEFVNIAGQMRVFAPPSYTWKQIALKLLRVCRDFPHRLRIGIRKVFL